MQIKVSSPNFDDDFLIKVHKATSKGSIVNYDLQGNTLLLEIFASNRILGRFTFIKDEDNFILEKKHVIEREYYPFELAIASLVKYCKRKKIKYILWN